MLYSTDNYSPSRLNLARIENSNFTVLEFDDFTPILAGYEYILLREDIAGFFTHLPKEQMVLRKASIKRLSTGETWENYLELEAKHSIDIESIKTYNKEIEVWCYNSGDSFHLFISTPLKNVIENSIEENILVFSEGFSHFA